MIKDLFNEVNRIKDLLETDFVEISVKQHQIDVVFKQDNGINLEDLNKIKKVFEKNHTFETPYLTTFEEEFHFTIPQIEKKRIKRSLICLWQLFKKWLMRFVCVHLWSM